MSALREIHALLQRGGTNHLRDTWQDPLWPAELSSPYVPAVYQMLKHDCSIEDLTDYLWVAESETLGRPLWPDQNLHLAKRLLDWWDTCPHATSQSEAQA